MISAVVLAKNEETNIKRCLESLVWCSEIIVVDDFSSDLTTSISKKFGAKVYKRKLNGDFAAQRNYGLTKATGGWALFIDPDEEVNGDLKQEILEKIGNTKASGFYIKRQDILFGKKLVGGEWGEQWLLRLAKTNSGKWERAVHEHWVITGKREKLSSSLLHSPDFTVFSFIKKINFYFQLHAESNAKDGKNVNLIKIIFWPILKFVNNFIIKRGYRDGVHGFVYATLMSFHSFLSWSELWLLRKTKV